MNCGFVALRLPPSACSGHIGMEGIGFPAKIANISRDKSRRTRYKTAQLSPMSFGLSIAWGGGVIGLVGVEPTDSPHLLVAGRSPSRCLRPLSHKTDHPRIIPYRP